MSSGNLYSSANPELFRWSAELDPSLYLRARYRVTSVASGEATAIGMAMEQSAATTAIRGFVSPAQLIDHTIRVVRVEDGGECSAADGMAFRLDTEVYAGAITHRSARCWHIELAIPLRLLQGKPSQLLNIVIGELPRLGFLSCFRLESCDLGTSFGPGPAFGITGIRKRFERPTGPLLCRSMRPAVGLDEQTMAQLNQAALAGGFHLVKDDELQVFPSQQVFRDHLVHMLTVRDAVRDRTGEHKGYVANLICEPDELQQRWDICCELGVDAVLVAPFIQGLGVLPLLARQQQMPLLAHNTCAELISRHADWGVDYAALLAWQIALGADWYVTEGNFAEAGTPSIRLPHTSYSQSAMPIIQGGKTPDGLPRYRHAIGSDDFMLIVASWVDNHADGLERAARHFRDAIDALPPYGCSASA